MIRLLPAMLLTLALAGCATTVDLTDYYSRADVDAINAETACRQMARNLVQVSRCAVRR